MVNNLERLNLNGMIFRKSDDGLSDLFATHKFKPSIEKECWKMDWINIEDYQYDVHITITNLFQEQQCVKIQPLGRLPFSHFIYIILNCEDLETTFEFFNSTMIKRRIMMGLHVNKSMRLIPIFTNYDETHHKKKQMLNKFNDEFNQSINNYAFIPKSGNIETDVRNYSNLEEFIENNIKSQVEYMLDNNQLSVDEFRKDNKEHLITMWEDLVKTKENFVIFEFGTWVYVDRSEKDLSKDIGELAIRIMDSWGPVMAGGSVGDFQIGNSSLDNVWLVVGHNNNILNFVSVDELEKDNQKDIINGGSNIIIGYRGRSKRHKDALSLNIIHKSD